MSHDVLHDAARHPAQGGGRTTVVGWGRTISADTFLNSLAWMTNGLFGVIIPGLALNLSHRKCLSLHFYTRHTSPSKAALPHRLPSLEAASCFTLKATSRACGRPPNIVKTSFGGSSFLPLLNNGVFTCRSVSGKTFVCVDEWHGSLIWKRGGETQKAGAQNEAKTAACFRFHRKCGAASRNSKEGDGCGM